MAAPGEALDHRKPSAWRGLGAWAVAYVAVGVAVVVLQPRRVVAVVPPLAVGVLLLWRFGLQRWPLIVACDLLVSLLQYGADPTVVFVVAAATTVEAVAVVAALRRFGFDPSFRRPIDVLSLTVASVIAAGVGATVGAWLTQVVRSIDSGGTTGAPSWQDQWQLWFIGDLTGLVTLLPLLFVMTYDAYGHRLSRPLDELRRRLELHAAIPAGLGIASGRNDLRT